MEEIFEVGNMISVLRDGQYKGTFRKEGITVEQLIES